MAQILPEAAGDAAGVLIYSLICLLASLTLLWLVWAHGEQTSYVAIIALAASLNAVSSTSRIINMIVNWRDIHIDMFYFAKAEYENPALVIFGAQTGAQRALFCIQYYVLNVEALAVACWAVDLTLSVYHVQVNKHKLVQTAAKIATFVLPAIQQGLLQIRAVQQSNLIFFYILANCLMFVGLCTGVVLIVPLLVRYIKTKRQLSAATGGSVQLSLSTTIASNYKVLDSWLVVRFTFAFIMLALFEVFTISYQVINAELLGYMPYLPQPTFSIALARRDIASFPAQVSGSLVTFIIFGTTKTYRSYMWSFMPKKIRNMKIFNRRKNNVPAAKAMPEWNPPTTNSQVAGPPYLKRTDTDELIFLGRSASSKSDPNDFIILQRMEEAKVKGGDLANHDDSFMWRNPAVVPRDLGWRPS